MPLRPRPEIENLDLCPHGGIDYDELSRAGVSLEQVLDFSVCTNPFMPPPGIGKVLAGVNLNEYPDSASTGLRKTLADKLSLAAPCILLGSGTTELIRLAALAYFRPGDKVAILKPTYGEYELACRIMGADPVGEWIGLSADLSMILDIIRASPPRAMFLCNPNNPTGSYFARREIEAILKTIGDGLLILDEAYVNFVPGHWSSLDLIENGNLLILRSMTKDYGLAGLRLGYAVARPDIIQSLRRVCPPWNVSSAAQRAGMMALESDLCLQQTLAQTLALKEYLVDSLIKLGFTVAPSRTHYFLVKVGNAVAFRQALLPRGILVRDCTSFGLPDYIRISPRTRPDCEKLVEAISRVDLSPLPPSLIKGRGNLGREGRTPSLRDSSSPAGESSSET